MKKTLLATLAIAALALSLPANASPIVTISLDNPNQTGTIGQTLEFFGVITNNTTSTVNIDGDDFDLTAPGVTLTDDFNNTPFSILPGASSATIELFDVTLGAGFTGFAPGVYDLSVDTGGAPSTNSTTFSVSNATPPTVTPEPASFLLLLTSLPAALVTIRKRIRR